MDAGLNGLCVAVTGASGGIGWAIAEALGDEGATLALHAHRAVDKLTALIAKRPLRERALVKGGDLRDPQVSTDFIDSAVARFGRVDVLITCAGIWPETSLRLNEQSEARIRDVIDINLMGTIWSVRAFMAALQRTGVRADDRGASIVLIGSTAGRFGEPGHAEYAASKSALAALNSSLAAELATIDPRARVNMVEPGWTVTPMARPSLDRPGVLERAVATMPLAQLANVADIASAVTYLASPTLARHVTGQILTVAGGMQGRLLNDRDSIDREALLRRSPT